MSVATITLTEVCFPDITGKTIRAWGTVTFTAGSYVTGGVTMGLLNFLDARTVDVNGLLRCDVYSETSLGTNNYNFIYVPATDKLVIIDDVTGKEVVNGAAVPATLVAATLLFEATVDRTTTRG